MERSIPVKHEVVRHQGVRNAIKSTINLANDFSVSVYYRNMTMNYPKIGYSGGNDTR